MLTAASFSQDPGNQGRENSFCEVWLNFWNLKYCEFLALLGPWHLENIVGAISLFSEVDRHADKFNFAVHTVLWTIWSNEIYVYQIKLANISPFWYLEILSSCHIPGLPTPPIRVYSYLHFYFAASSDRIFFSFLLYK